MKRITELITKAQDMRAEMESIEDYMVNARRMLTEKQKRYSELMREVDQIDEEIAQIYLSTNSVSV